MCPIVLDHTTQSERSKTELYAQSMDQDMYSIPHESDVDRCVLGSARAAYTYCIEIAEAHPTLVRHFMEEAAREVA